MKAKFFAVSAAALVVSSFMFACSSSSSGGSAGSCPTVGAKNCPNDTAATQSDVDTCNKCQSQANAFATCAQQNGITISTTESCGADGTSQPQKLTTDQLNTLTSKCGSQLSASTNCATGASSGDGGS